MEQPSIDLKIGQVVITASGDESCPPLSIQPSHQPFLVENGKSDVTLRVHYGNIPETYLEEKIFESKGPWAIYRHQENFLIPFFSAAISSPPPYRLVRCNETFSDAELYVRSYEPFDGSLPPGVVYPFEYPLDELLMVNYLARGRLGVIIHACGLNYGGDGLVFAGVSGAGKSTLARLWQQTRVPVLSDERLILRPGSNGRFWIDGTPWSGEAGIGLPESAPLEKLFIIQHAPRNYVKPLSRMEAATRLLVRCFPPFYDREGMAYITELLAQVAAEVPCFELGFVSDASVIDFVRGLE